MFTQSCFLRKNTPDIQERLKKLGIPHNDFDEGNRPWIAYNHGLWISVDEGHDRLFPEDIDCGDNEELFLALASLRDDTDRHQWFVDDNTCIWERSENELPSRYMQMEGHKATVEEIIKHFT